LDGAAARPLLATERSVGACLGGAAPPGGRTPGRAGLLRRRRGEL